MQWDGDGTTLVFSVSFIPHPTNSFTLCTGPQRVLERGPGRGGSDIQGFVYHHGPKSGPRAVLKENKRKGFATPTETNVRGDALRVMVKTWARNKTTETVLNNGWRLAVHGGCP